MTSLPSDADVRARAEEQKLVEPGADIPRDVRRRVAKELLAESQKPATPAGPPTELLSRVSHSVPGGTIRVDVVFIPTQKEDPS